MSSINPSRTRSLAAPPAAPVHPVAREALPPASADLAVDGDRRHSRREENAGEREDGASRPAPPPDASRSTPQSAPQSTPDADAAATAAALGDALRHGDADACLLHPAPAGVCERALPPGIDDAA